MTTQCCMLANIKIKSLVSRKGAEEPDGAMNQILKQKNQL
jgi:hypothetical protein